MARKRGAAVAVGDHPQRQQRRRDAPLEGDEGHQQDRAGGQEGERDGVAPAVGLRARQAEDEREQAARGQQRARDVEPRARTHRRVLEQPRAGDRRGHGEEDRHVQAPAPAERLGQRAAEQQSDRAAHARDRGVDAERLAALRRIGERRRQQRQRGRGEQRAEGALQRARADEHAEAVGRATDGRGAGEAQQADDEGPLAPEQVPDPAAEQQQRAERQRVGGDHPLAVVVGEAEVALRGRQRDVDDGHVEHDHQLGDPDHHQDQPSSFRHEQPPWSHRSRAERHPLDGTRRKDVTVDDVFEASRPQLRAVAYRMLGSLTEAEDAVQETWLRLHRSDTSEVDNLRAWLTTVVARVSLDMLRSRRSRREEPLEARLPEPIVTTGPEDEALLADGVGLALLVVLETLTPAERLAFVLHDLFAVPFEAIAPIVDRSPAAARAARQPRPAPRARRDAGARHRPRPPARARRRVPRRRPRGRLRDAAGGARPRGRAARRPRRRHAGHPRRGAP